MVSGAVVRERGRQAEGKKNGVVQYSEKDAGAYNQRPSRAEPRSRETGQKQPVDHARGSLHACTADSSRRTE